MIDFSEFQNYPRPCRRTLLCGCDAFAHVGSTLGPLVVMMNPSVETCTSQQNIPLSDVSNPFYFSIPDAPSKRSRAHHYTAFDQELFVPLQINPVHACFPPPEPQPLTGMLKTTILSNLQQLWRFTQSLSYADVS